MSDDTPPATAPGGEATPTSQEAEGHAPRKRWRRANAEDGPRPLVIQVKCSPDEYARIQAEADVRRISRPAVLLRALKSDGATAAAHYELLMRDLLQARRGLAHLSTNLNQAVKLEHTRRLEGDAALPSSEFEHDLEQLLGQVRGVVERIEQVTDEAAR